MVPFEFVHVMLPFKFVIWKLDVSFPNSQKYEATRNSQLTFISKIFSCSFNLRPLSGWDSRRSSFGDLRRGWKLNHIAVMMRESEIGGLAWGRRRRRWGRSSHCRSSCIQILSELPQIHALTIRYTSYNWEWGLKLWVTFYDEWWGCESTGWGRVAL